MKVTKKLPINIIDLIHNIERNSAMWEVDVIEEFIKFVNTDKHVITVIREMLISRLKYATGRLYNSISVQAFEGQGGGQDSVTEHKNINVFLTIDTNNKDVINALLGESELESRPIAKPPTILDLTRWIRGKRRFFDKPIEAIRDRRRDVVRALAQRQRLALLDGGDAEPLNMPKRLAEYQDPVYHLAKVIRGRMVRRVAKGLPPTKGSEYVFLGNYPEYEGKHSRRSFAPKYSRLATPLLTVRLRKNVIGDINVFMGTVVEEYYNRVMRAYIKKGMAGELLQGGRGTRAGDADVAISRQLKSLTTEQAGSIVEQSMRLINRVAEIVESAPGSNRTKAKAAWLKQSRASIMTAIDDLFPVMNKQANEANRQIFMKLKESRRMLRNIKAFVPPPVKRRAIRFKRKR